MSELARLMELFREMLRDGKGLADLISRLTLGLALIPVLGYGLWLIAGRPFEAPAEPLHPAKRAEE